jgi:hypothetical protein
MRSERRDSRGEKRDLQYIDFVAWTNRESMRGASQAVGGAKFSATKSLHLHQ